MPSEIRRMSGESSNRLALATIISNPLLLKDWKRELGDRTLRRSARYLSNRSMTQIPPEDARYACRILRESGPQGRGGSGGGGPGVVGLTVRGATRRPLGQSCLDG